jgi:16S rRNA (uracil1498-N3)-methyltransferase
VLRLKRGDTFMGRDLHGRLHQLRIDAEQKGALIVRGEPYAEEQAHQGVSSGASRISLYQCLPKGRKMDLIVRQATELGVHGIVPTISDFTESRLDGKETQRSARWRRIAREAAQQCGIRRLPEIKPSVSLENIAALADDHLGIVFHPDIGKAERLLTRDLHGLLASAPSDIDLFVGPEGGFSHRELQRLRNLGCSFVSLGETVLRVETAALAALAAVKIILLENRCWTVG